MLSRTGFMAGNGNSEIRFWILRQQIHMFSLFYHQPSFYELNQFLIVVYVVVELCNPPKVHTGHCTGTVVIATLLPSNRFDLLISNLWYYFRFVHVHSNVHFICCCISNWPNQFRNNNVYFKTFHLFLLLWLFFSVCMWPSEAQESICGLERNWGNWFLSRLDRHLMKASADKEANKIIVLHTHFMLHPLTLDRSLIEFTAGHRQSSAHVHVASLHGFLLAFFFLNFRFVSNKLQMHKRRQWWKPALR